MGFTDNSLLAQDNDTYLSLQKTIMIYLICCDDKEKVLDKIFTREKTMVIRGATGRKIPHSRVFAGETLYFMKKRIRKI